jgi:hypothetical protein
VQLVLVERCGHNFSVSQQSVIAAPRGLTRLAGRIERTCRDGRLAQGSPSNTAFGTGSRPPSSIAVPFAASGTRR